MLLKKAELDVIRSFNKYRLPFVFASMSFCLLCATRSRFRLLPRVLPTLVLTPFTVMYNSHVGIYGVHKKITTVLENMIASPLADSESEVKRLWLEFTNNN